MKDIRWSFYFQEIISLKPYEWILFDADETLFRFDGFSGLQHMFARFGVQFTREDYIAYQTINKPLWVDYQNGNITATQIQHRRFDAWAKKLQSTPEELNLEYMASMAEICLPLDGAVNLLNTLKNDVNLGIITNGFTSLQNIRLERTGLKNHFDLLVISEQLGVAKPHPAIFDHALALVGNPARENVLMVGDNPESDIRGGMNAGIDTCWLNADNKPTPDGIKPNYQVSSLSELQTLLSNALFQ